MQRGWRPIWDEVIFRLQPTGEILLQICCRNSKGPSRSQLTIAFAGAELSQRRFASTTGIAKSDNRSLISERVNSLSVSSAWFLRHRSTRRCARDVLGLAMHFRLDDSPPCASQIPKSRYPGFDRVPTECRRTLTGANPRHAARPHYP